MDARYRGHLSPPRPCGRRGPGITCAARAPTRGCPFSGPCSDPWPATCRTIRDRSCHDGSCGHLFPCQLAPSTHDRARSLAPASSRGRQLCQGRCRPGRGCSHPGRAVSDVSCLDVRLPVWCAPVRDLSLSLPPAAMRPGARLPSCEKPNRCRSRWQSAAADSPASAASLPRVLARIHTIDRGGPQCFRSLIQ